MTDPRDLDIHTDPATVDDPRVDELYLTNLRQVQLVSAPKLAAQIGQEIDRVLDRQPAWHQPGRAVDREPGQ